MRNIPRKLKLNIPELSFLEKAKEEIYDYFLEVREDFDGSEYQQGKKDGLRIALTFLGCDNMIEFNRGNRLSRDNFGGLGNEEKKE